MAIAIPVIVALYVATQSTRYQMDHRDFERDRNASFAYLERMKGIYAINLQTNDSDQAKRTLWTISDAGTQWLKASSGAERLGGFFTNKYIVCNQARRAFEGGAWEVKHELGVGNGLNQLAQLVNDWPYPERRPETMRKVLEDTASPVHRSSDVPIRLQVDRWMLTSVPSPYKVVRGGRSAVIRIRWLWQDAKRGRLKERIKNWRISRQDLRAMRKKYGRHYNGA
jgi:hypothetical protein